MSVRRRRGPIKSDGIDMDGMGYVFDLMRPHILERHIYPIADQGMCFSRNTYAAGVGETFEPGGHVHTFAMDVFPIIDDVAEVDTGPKDRCGCPREAAGRRAR